VIVAGGGDAVAQQSGMIGEEAIGLNDVSAGLGAGNMLRISSGTASNAALQTICPMYGRTTTFPRALLRRMASTPVS
jgi:hypothetical protein